MLPELIAAHGSTSEANFARGVARAVAVAGQWVRDRAAIVAEPRNALAEGEVVGEAPVFDAIFRQGACEWSLQDVA